MISVIVSSYNQLEQLKLFLEAMECQACKDFEVVIAEDGSNDGTNQWLCPRPKPFPFDLTVFMRPHDGYRLASLQNAGAEIAAGDRLLFTNADVIHCRDSICSHAECLPNEIGIGSIVESEPGGRMNCKRGRAPRADLAWGGNMSIDAKMFRRVGGFDEKFTHWGGEDGDLSRRCEEAGGVPRFAHGSVGVHLAHPRREYHPRPKVAACTS